MKVRLLRQARITVKAGEIVEVSPAEAAFLLSIRSAEPVPAVKETPVAPARSTANKKKG
jgi:hypothetical protein